jgi:hypothetical protein
LALGAVALGQAPEQQEPAMNPDLLTYPFPEVSGPGGD